MQPKVDGDIEQVIWRPYNPEPENSLATRQKCSGRREPTRVVRVLTEKSQSGLTSTATEIGSINGLLNFPQHNHAVCSTKCKAVLERDLDVFLERLAEHEVERAFGIRIVQVP